MREFYLLNGNGIKFDLMSSQGFFHAPDGLGLQNTQTFLRTGNFYKNVESYEAQKSVTGEMVFKSYEDYKAFADFIAIKPLKLVYKPIDTEYTLDCSIASLQKSEISHNNNRLICPITFAGESKWYILREAIIAHPYGSDSKRYDYKYDYVYYNGKSGIVEGINNSPYESPCILHLQGYLLNPAWTLTVNNEQIASGQVMGEIFDGNQLIVNSRDDSLEIAEYTDQNVFLRNMYQNAVFEKQNFIYVPSGSFRITITDDSLSPVTAYLQMVEEYDTI